MKLEAVRYSFIIVVIVLEYVGGGKTLSNLRYEFSLFLSKAL